KKNFLFLTRKNLPGAAVLKRERGQGFSPPSPLACTGINQDGSHHSGCADDHCSRCAGKHSSYAQTDHNNRSASWRGGMNHPMFLGS
ncbi:hypothetical protein ACMD7D_004172, partial [Citrobacter freundii]